MNEHAAAHAASRVSMVLCKYRIRFRKRGALRLISHHDLLRSWERMLRRAALPYHSTSGFNPKPRLVFALSLALGIEGWDEVVELELDAPVGADELQARLTEQAPAGLDITSVRSIAPKTTAQVRCAHYRIPMSDERASQARDKIAALLAQEHCWVERRRPEPRKIDVRPYVRSVSVNDGNVELELLVTPNGSARPEEIVHLLGFEMTADWGIIQRTKLELMDE